ncbi:hypothetical protein [Flavobacterium sp.]|uniref:hypothetical protein n=1 Tax=Flavobacterium sp. TaxID=239 RepID=UPI00260EDBC7|nr:hypothetical protein [Flavobacterium sp.]
MNLDEFNRLTLAAKIPPLDAQQWEELGASDLGYIYQSLNPSEISPDQIELVVRACSDRVRQTLAALKLQYDLNQILSLAKVHGKVLFQHIHYASNHPESKAFLKKAGIQDVVVVAPYYSFPIYGAQAALTIAEGTTPSGTATINLEGAHALSGRYDWQHKIIFQLSFNEMIETLLVLTRTENKKVFTGHGRLHDKMMEIEAQNGNFFVRLIQREVKAIAVPVSFASAIRMTSLIRAQIQKTDPAFSIEDFRIVRGN